MTTTPTVAISVLQPWASALLGPKDGENRTWRLPASYRDVPIALHASKRKVAAEQDAFYQTAIAAGMSIGEISAYIDPPLGAIIGVITFSDDLPYRVCGIYQTAPPSPWCAGPVFWCRASVIALPRPIPCKGALGFWHLTPEQQAEIARQLQEALR